MWKAVWFGLFCVLVAGTYAQQPVPVPGPGATGAAAGKQKGSQGTLSVTVVEKGTKLPMEGALLSVVGPNGSEIQTQTDNLGKFTSSFPPGSYRLTVRRRIATGNVGMPAGKVASIKDNEETKVELEVPKTALVRGTVTDARGQPANNVRITLLMRAYEVWSDRAIYQNTPMIVQTNDIGEYTMENVPTGLPFYVYAEPMPSDSEPYAAEPADPARRRPINAATFYPAATDAGAAQTVIFSEGEQRDGLNITMARTASYCVEDKVLPQPPAGIKYSISVDVVEVNGGVFNDYGSYRSGRTIQLNDPGKARVCGLWPGSYRYTIQPQGREPQGTAFIGSGEFQIKDTDLSRLVVNSSTTFDTEGELVIEGPQPAESINTKFSLNMIGLTTTAGGAGAETGIPGTFTFHGLHADRYALRVTPVPDGWYIKSILYGKEDLAQRTARFVLDKPGAPLKVVMRTDGARFHINVTDKKGESLIGQSVLVVRAGLMTSPQRLVGTMMTGYSDARGEISAFTLVNQPPRAVLAPGEYYVLATDIPVNQTADVLESVWRTLQSDATRVTLQPSETGQVTVKLVTLR
ncbi:MAG: carboxypeptidase-like regulatory domain-containing protein [Acidobacteriota bacterium]